MTRRAPDLGIILGERRGQLRGSKVIQLIPDLVVEVISPSETGPSIHRKLRQYFEAGVKGAWVVYPESGTVEAWTTPTVALRVLRGDDALTSPLLPGFTLPLQELFG